jgi:hypothetical protein
MAKKLKRDEWVNLANVSWLHPLYGRPGRVLNRHLKQVTVRFLHSDGCGFGDHTLEAKDLVRAAPTTDALAEWMLVELGR